MILIADSGSTKCDWIALDSLGVVEIGRAHTMGFNPYFHSPKVISDEIKANPHLGKFESKVSKVFYYGAGCSSSELNKIIETALSSCFPKASISVNHDLLGAAYAAYQDEPNITCILGTGSNSCYFDGKKLKQSVPSLGFILGDEGSGSYFGKKLVSAYLYGHLPEIAEENFAQIFKLSKQEVIQNVYVKPNANVYLAGFAPFISEYKTHPFFQNMLQEGMMEFLTVHVLAYPEHKNVKVNFVGSIAHHFKESLQSASRELGLSVGKIIQKPVDELVTYHRKYIL